MGRTPTLPDELTDRLANRMRELVPDYDSYLVDVQQGVRCEYKPDPDNSYVDGEDEKFM